MKLDGIQLADQQYSFNNLINDFLSYYGTAVVEYSNQVYAAKAIKQ